ncbi:MAG: hypothetical protein EOP40_07485 [Rubrivivax sp.]|nr:MAG: hypothetical protein EOP40_07485 [Rubrivivax sp.]
MRHSLPMPRPAPRSRSHAVVALGMMLVLMAQLWLGGYQAVAATTGTEVCSVNGPLRVDADGQPIPASGHHGHDCCLASATAAAPEPLGLSLATLTHAAPALALGAARLGAEALTPLSRGPPHLLT